LLTTEVLARKRDGGELSDDEIRFLVDGFVDGRVTDYQMSAFAMAVCIRGMTPREIATLTMAMTESGDRLQAVDQTPRVDKHSTGGLGDKVSLILAPLLATCGVHVPMISGRGLGLTGGTLDKLESLSGFQTSMPRTQSDRMLQTIGCFIVGADDRIAPADRKLYALRDVTATVPSVALITASILSKKLAASLDALVMDVKVGSAAFMKTIEDAQCLAKSLIDTGRQAGLKMSALITDMDQPLGTSVGNAIEVNESIAVLSGQPGPVRDLTIALSAEALALAKNMDRDEATRQLIRQLDQGFARERFEQMVREQGGRWPIDEALPVYPAFVIESPQDGYLESIDCHALGSTIVACGGGRRTLADSIDPAVGITVHHRIGDAVVRGEPILSLHAGAADRQDYANVLESSFSISDAMVAPRNLVQTRCL
jgi:pyrimidine-nucleoside phosphorylase